MAATTSQKDKVITGFAFHCHRMQLVEFVTDYNEQVKSIKNEKPLEEQKLRLRLFKMIPLERVPYDLVEAWKALGEAGKAYDEAWKAYGEAGKAYDEAWKALGEARKALGVAGKAFGKARKAYDEAWKALGVAGKAFGEARKAYGEAEKAYGVAWKAYDEGVKNSQDYFSKLHAELCPDCPWDGKTIFPKKGGKR